MRMTQALILLATLCTPGAAWAQSDPTVLFIGNSFTYGHGSPVRFYRSDTVTDLNNTGIGGVPALFKSFPKQGSDFRRAYRGSYFASKELGLDPGVAGCHRVA